MQPPYPDPARSPGPGEAFFRVLLEDYADVIVVLTADAAGARERIAATAGGAGQFASYRSLLDRQGMSGIHETAITGDERVIERAVRAYAEAGATELVASLHGSEQEKVRTRGLLSALRGPA